MKKTRFEIFEKMAECKKNIEELEKLVFFEGMTKERLNSYKYIVKENEAILKQIRKLEEASKQFCELYGENEKSENIDKKIKQLCEELYEKTEEYADESRKIEEFIVNIPYADVRLIFRYRFINSLNWEEIARLLGVKDESVVRKKMLSYLRRKGSEK